MEKLTMQDATFLYSETVNVLNQIATLQRFVASLRIYLMDRIRLLPYLTRKVKMIPGRIGHAVWVHVSIPTHGIGLNITIQSYCDDLIVSLTGRKKAVANICILKDDVMASLLELKTLVLPLNISEIESKQEISKIQSRQKASGETKNFTKVA
ncbi:MAG: hypothetical protein ACJAX5_002367 [Patiriisocius sp.]|jgi:hypothetical protein